MSRVVFATGDIKPGKLGVEIAQALMAKGAETIVFAAGPSEKVWRDAGFSVGDEADLEQAVRDLRPSVLVAGLSSPQSTAGTELEARAFATRVLGLKTVFLDDDWGAFSRTSLAPTMYLTIDRMAENMILKYFGIYAPHISLMGDDAVGLEVDPQSIEAVENLRKRYKHIALLSGNKDPRTEAVLDVALRSLRASGETAALIPRLHPGTKAEVLDSWRAKLGQFSQQYGGIEMLPEVKRSDDLAALADITFAVGGTHGRIACHNGRTPAFVWSSSIGKMLKEETSQEHHALVEEGVGLEVREATSFQLILELDSPRKEERKKLLTPAIPFSPEKAAEAILALAR